MNNIAMLNAFTQSIQAHAEEIKATQKAYLIAKATEETIKGIAQDIQKKILANGEYMVMPEFRNRKGTPERITEPKHTYLMDEEIFINDFLEKCYAEYQKAGIADPRGKEYCPEAEVHEERKQAENKLLQIAIDILPDEFQEEKNVLRQAMQHWKYRNEILNLILRLGIAK